MRKLLFSILFASTLVCCPLFSQNKNTGANTKQTTVTEKPDAGDKVIQGKKGPNGQAVYQGVNGGVYYINKNGNKTYLKETDKAIANKKGPNGEKVYAGPQGGEYYINKSGNKVYLKNNKK
jgi:hypothetical protein